MARSTQEYYKSLLKDPKVKSFLDTISYAEGTPGSAGYQTMFTGKQFDPSKGWKHPRALQTGGGYTSDAAGKYQYLSTTWEGVQKELGLPDFSPQSQDIGALHLLKRRGALDPLLKGDITTAIHKSAPEWASLPTAKGGSYYGQPSKSLTELQKYYQQKLGQPISTTPQVATTKSTPSQSAQQTTQPVDPRTGQPININLIIPGEYAREKERDPGTGFLNSYISDLLKTPQMRKSSIDIVGALTKAASSTPDYFG